MGAGAWTRHGLRFRRLLYHGICLPGDSEIQAHRFMATATRVLLIAVDDLWNNPTDLGSSVVTDILRY